MPAQIRLVLQSRNACFHISSITDRSITDVMIFLHDSGLRRERPGGYWCFLSGNRMQGPGHTVQLSARVQLPKAAAETIQVSLRCCRVFDRIECRIPAFGATAKGPRLESRIVGHASEHVTNPLLLPPAAVSSVKADVAEVVTFPVHMHGMQCGEPQAKSELKVCTEHLRPWWP